MKLISAFVFATRIVQFLFYLNPKFQASSSFLSLYSPVCVGPGRKPRRPVFSRRGSYALDSMDMQEMVVIELIMLNVHVLLDKSLSTEKCCILGFFKNKTKLCMSFQIVKVPFLFFQNTVVEKINNCKSGPFFERHLHPWNRFQLEISGF